MNASSDPRVALVTGANRGMGREIARQLAEAHLHVLVGARDGEAAGAAAEEISDGGRLSLQGVQLDVTDDQSVARLAERVASDPGRLDVLVNNAGIIGGSYADTIADVDLGGVRTTLDTNLFGPWRIVQAFLPLLRSGGRGRIVNMSTGMALLSEMGAGAPSYRVSKTALNALTVILSIEEAPNGIHVNALNPGWVKTDMGGEGADRSIEQGADTAVWLALQGDDGPTGGFFKDRELIPW